MANDERTRAAKITAVAVDLVAEVSGRIEAAVSAACGERSDLIRYVVGAAFVAVGAGIMRRYYKTAIVPTAEAPAMGADWEAHELVRGVFKEA